jgi:O-antigen/teichoic acid export membrane protein
VMGAGFVVGAWWLGGTVLGNVFGPEYGEVSGPLAWYAAATSMFAIANLIVSHHLSLDQRRESFVLIGGAAVQTILLLIGRGDIDSLIRAQVIAMAILLIAVVTSHIISRKGG